MTSGGTESILMSMLVKPRTRPRPRNRAAADSRAGLRASRVRQAAHLTSAWSSCACRSTPDYRADARAAAELIGPSNRGGDRVGVQLPVRDHGSGRGARRARGRARCRLPCRCVHRRVRAAVSSNASGATFPCGTSGSRGSPTIYRRRAQVRVLPEGRVGGPAPRRGLVRAPGVPLRPVALGALRITGDGGRASGRTDRDRVGGHHLPRCRRVHRDHAGSDGHHREGARRQSRRSTASRSSATRSGRSCRSVPRRSISTRSPT